MQTNRIAPQNLHLTVPAGVDPQDLTQEDINELTALMQPDFERAGTWRGWLCCCLRCLFPCICCIEACCAYRVSKKVFERVEARAQARAAQGFAPEP